jgi:hypothetical protein
LFSQHHLQSFRLQARRHPRRQQCNKQAWGTRFKQGRANVNVTSPKHAVHKTKLSTMIGFGYAAATGLEEIFFKASARSIYGITFASSTRFTSGIFSTAKQRITQNNQTL